MTKKQIAKLWRAAAKGHKVMGRIEESKRAARTAAMIEGRPWKVDRIC